MDQWIKELGVAGFAADQRKCDDDEQLPVWGQHLHGVAPRLPDLPRGGYVRKASVRDGPTAEGGQCDLADIRQGIPYVSQPRPFGLRPVVFLLKHHIKNGAEALEMQSGAEALERNSPKWLRTC